MMKAERLRRKREKEARDYARKYGSEARVKFVKSLPCAACGVVGFSENAHVPPTAESGGAGRKADYRFIVPLCGPHRTDMNRVGLTSGHHWILDKLLGREKFEAEYCVNFDELAADTEKRWLEFSGTQLEEK